MDVAANWPNIESRSTTAAAYYRFGFKDFFFGCRKKPRPMLERAWSHLGFTGNLMIRTRTIRTVEAEVIFNGRSYRVDNTNMVALAPSYDEATMYIQDLARPPVEGADIQPQIAQNTFKLSKFVDSCSIIIKGEHIKRSSVILFLRNKRGGARGIDWNQDREEKREFSLLAEIYDPQPINMPDGSASYVQFTMESGLNLVELCVRNMARDLINSPDVQKIIRSDPNHTKQ